MPLESKEKLDNILEFQTTIHKNFRVKLDSLNITVPLQLEESVEFGDPTLNHTGIYLKQLLSNETDSRKKRVIIEALTNLQKFEKRAES